MKLNFNKRDQVIPDTNLDPPKGRWRNSLAQWVRNGLLAGLGILPVASLTTFKAGASSLKVKCSWLMTGKLALFAGISSCLPSSVQTCAKVSFGQWFMRLTAFESGAGALKSSVYVWRGIVFAALIVGIMANLFPIATFAWSGNPSVNTPIYVAPPNQRYQSGYVCGAVADGVGGTYVVFTEGTKSYIEHLNKDGDIIDSKQSGIKCNKYVGNGVVSDGSGSIIISSERIVTDNAGGRITILWKIWDKSISVQRSNAIGNQLWNRTVSSSGTTIFYDIGFTSDGKGGIFVVWSEFHGKPTQYYDIYAQYLKHDGTAQWGNGVNGVAISTAAFFQIKPIIMKDGTGGAIIAWVDYRKGEKPSDSRKFVDTDIYAQRVNAEGESQWVHNGVPIVTKNGTQDEPVMIRTSDGVIITWWDQRRGNNNDVYAQKINNNGQVQWTEDGVKIFDTLFNLCTPELNRPDPACLPNFPRIVDDGENGAIIFWSDYRKLRDEQDLYAQRIDSNGQIMWKTNGLSVSTGRGHQRVRQVLKNDGKAIVIIADHGSRKNGTGTSFVNDIYAECIEMNGALCDSEPASISGTVWNDNDCDGTPDKSTSGKGGVTVQAGNDTDITGQDGKYTVSVSDHGAKDIYVTPSSLGDGWSQTSPNHNVYIREYETVTGIDFGVGYLELPSITTPSDMCTGDAPFKLEASSSDGGTVAYAGNYVSGDDFNPSEAGTYEITYTATKNKCTRVDKQPIVVKPSPSVIFSSLPAEICGNDAEITLLDTPVGGTYTGSGIISTSSGWKFSPSYAGVDVHTISYKFIAANQCATTVEQTITVKQSPTVNFSLQAEICDNDAVITPLFGTPEGGTYTGSGIIHTSSGWGFSPSDAGVGNHTISYEFTATNLCATTVEQTITVKQSPTVTFNLPTEACDNGIPIQLTGGSPAGGVYSGNGVVNTVGGSEFYPAIAGAGTHTISYTVTENSCTKTATAEIEVKESPSVDFQLVSSEVCDNGIPIQLTGGSPAGGVYSGNGVTNGEFDPAIAGVGTHFITYSVTENSCPVEATAEIEVKTSPSIVGFSSNNQPVSSPAVTFAFPYNLPNELGLSYGSTVASSFSWYKPNSTVPLSPAQATEVGVYRVEYADPISGCPVQANFEVQQGVYSEYVMGAYCIDGRPNGSRYSWKITEDGNPNSMLRMCKEATGTASNLGLAELVDNFVKSIEDTGGVNSGEDCTGTGTFSGTVPILLPPDYCFSLNPSNPFDLYVGAAFNEPSCLVDDINNSCAYNPTIKKVALKCALPPQDVLASYSFNEEDETYINDPVSTTGKVNGAASFNGSNYVEIPHNSNLDFGVGDFSISVWVKTSDHDAFILTKEYNQRRVDNVQGYALFISNGNLSLRLADGNGSWRCSTGANASCTNYSSGKSISDGEWHLVVVTVDRDDPNGGKFYVDGVEVSTFDPTPRSGLLDTENPLKLASGSSGTRGMLNGELDEVVSYRRALTKEETYLLYKNDSAGMCRIDESGPPSQPVLSVTPTSKDILATSGSFTFDVANIGNSTMDWTAQTDASWLTISSVSGTNNGTITVNYSANSGNARTGTITVTAGGADNSPQTVEVKQVAKPCETELTVTPVIRALIWRNPRTTFALKNKGSCAMKWTSKPYSSWFSVFPNKGVDNATLNVTAEYSWRFRVGRIITTAFDAKGSQARNYVFQKGHWWWWKPWGFKTFSGSIKPKQVIPHPFSVAKPFKGPILFNVTWPGSDLDLAITTPSGKQLTKDSPEVLDLYAGDTEEYWLIESEEQGDWQVEVVAVEVDEAGESYELSIIANERTEPPTEDTDGDDLPDEWEEYFLGDLSQDGNADSDGDGVPNWREFQKNMNPASNDTDGDGEPDLHEIAQPARCQLYAVHDGKLNDSQFFTVNLDDLTVSELGPMYEGHDIESLAIHPETNIIYAASGDDVTNWKPGYFYRVDGETGELFPVGSTNFNEIEDLAFSPDGTLYAWAKGDGLITIDDLITGKGTLILPYDKPLIEGLTLKKNDSNVFFGAVGTDLWQYDMAANTLEVICPNKLLGETEALEIMPDGLITPDGLLLVGTHKVPFGLHAFDAQTCEIIEADETLSNQYNDVEGIAVPVAACK